jgi:hypothetical protein
VILFKEFPITNFTMRLKCLLLVIIVVVLSTFKAEAQQIYFYEKKSEGSFITSEIARIDSVVSRVFGDTAACLKKYHAGTMTNYYWKSDDLVCAVYFSKDSSGFHRTEWLFEDGLAVFMRHTVRLKDGKYERKDRYYFSRHSDASGGKGALFAWFWFGKRVKESSPEYELRFSSLPAQGASVYENGIRIYQDK